MNNKAQNIAIGTLGSYALLKLPQSNIDPYTRFAFGSMVGIGLFSYGTIKRNPTIQWLGIGALIGSILTLEEVIRMKGGKIVSNESQKPIYVLREDEGIKEFKQGEIPNYRIDGLTTKGLNKVFKVRDGVYLKILRDGTITETFGVGKIFNKITFAGFKSEKWVNEQKNKGWANLYKMSVQQ